MISCVAIDDEPLALEILQEFCKRVPFIKLEKTFTDANEAARYVAKFPVELLFLDIQMPDISGIDFYKLHAADKMVIFTTAFSEYAVEGFNLSAIDYLLKPFEFDRFLSACHKANDYFHYLYNSGKKETRHLFVRSEYSLIKISFSEIIYIETLDDYIKIHVDGRKPVLTKMYLKAVSGKLPDDFVRVHRSYIVPLKRITSVRGKNIFLNGAEIPIGTTYEAEFFRVYTG